MDAQSFFVDEEETIDPFDAALKAATSQTAEKEEEKVDPTQQGEDQKQDDPNAGEEEVPFHKHPRFKEVYDNLKHEREARKELEDRLKEFEGKLATKQEPQPVSVPTWWGGDEESWKLYSQHQQMLVETAKKEALEEFKRDITERQKKEVEETNLAKEAFSLAVAELREKYGKFDENKLFKVIDDYRPTNQEGNWWDFERAFKIMQLQEQAESIKAQKSVESKKQVASISASLDSPSTQKPKIKPGMNWREFYQTN